MKHDQITARFGGCDRTFKIHRQDLPAFERYVGFPAFALFKQFTDGHWTVKQVRDTLRFATLGEKTLELHRGAMALLGAPPFQAPIRPSFTDTVLADRPVAPYAILAMNVVAAALFGVGDEDATFSDEPVDA